MAISWSKSDEEDCVNGSDVNMYVRMMYLCLEREWIIFQVYMREVFLLSEY